MSKLVVVRLEVFCGTAQVFMRGGGDVDGGWCRSMPLNSSMEGTARVVEGRKANTGDEKAKKKGSLFFEVKKVVPGGSLSALVLCNASC